MRITVLKKALSGILALTFIAGSVQIIPFSSNTPLLKTYAEETNEIKIDKTYLKAGEPLRVTNAGGYQIKYYVDDVEVSGDDFVLSAEDYEKWIKVEAYEEGNDEPVFTDRAYFSNLPVIYINTEDEQPVTSKEKYLSGAMSIQNNTESGTLYSGNIKIKGRGNTSWAWPKKPYRIKLDKKTDLFGMGKNKNWVLLANYLDESLLRNTTAFRLSEELGLTSMQSIPADVVFNGEYIGNYQLCEQIRIDKDRVDIFDLENEAEEVASAVYKHEKKSGIILDKDELEDYLKQNLSWVTDNTFTFNGVNYNIDKYYSRTNTSEDGTYNISGGYLFEISNDFDEISQFSTDAGLKVMVKSPEYLNNNSEMMQYVQDLWQDFENAYRSEDGYAETANGKKHYTEIADIDTMVSFWLVMEIMGNNDSIYKSRFAYKEVDDLIKFGPVWDFDWGCGSSLVSPNAWQWVVSKNSNSQAFYKEFLDDPLFISKATEKYWEIRPYLESLIATGGILDTEYEYLKRSGEADDNRWDRSVTWPGKARGFEADTAAFKTYLSNHISWLDSQSATDDKLLAGTYTQYSAAPYERSKEAIKISSPNSSTDIVSDHAPADCLIKTDQTLKLNVNVNDEDTVSLNTYVNGLFYGNLPLDNGTAVLELPSDSLTAETGKKNVVSFIGKDSGGNTTKKNFITVKQNDSQAEIPPSFQKNNIILSGKIGVNFYLDLSSLTNEEKEASYVEFILNGKKTTAPFDAGFTNSAGTYHGFTCYVTSVEMYDTITAIFHYGENQTITQTYSVLDYINSVDEKADSYDPEILSLVHAMADYGHYIRPLTNEKYAETDKKYTDTYDYEVIKDNISDLAVIHNVTGNDIDKISFSLYPDTSIKIYLKTVNGYSGPVTINGESPEKLSDGRYCYVIPDIAAHSLGNMYDIDIVTGSGSAKMRVSAMSYVYEILNSDEYADNSIAKNAVAALYNYYTAATEYKNKRK